MKPFAAAHGATGQPTFAVPGADSIYHYSDVTTADTVTVPSEATIALFSATGDFYVRWDGGTAVVPSSAVEDGTGSEVNPIARAVKPGQTFSIVSETAIVVSICFYSN